MEPEFLTKTVQQIGTANIEKELDNKELSDQSIKLLNTMKGAHGGNIDEAFIKANPIKGAKNLRAFRVGEKAGGKGKGFDLDNPKLNISIVYRNYHRAIMAGMIDKMREHLLKGGIVEHVLLELKDKNFLEKKKQEGKRLANCGSNPSPTFHYL